MTIRQGRYVVAETEQEKKVRVTEIQRAEEDSFIRRSEVQQKVNSSTLPVSSRAVNLVIDDKIESGDLASKQYVDQKFNSIDLSSYASITYVDEKFNSIDLSKYLTIEKANQTYSTKTELIGKWDVQETVGNSSGKVMREGAYGLGGGMLHTGDGNTENLQELLRDKTTFYVNNHDINFNRHAYGIQFVNGRDTRYKGYLSCGWTSSNSKITFQTVSPQHSKVVEILTDKNTIPDSKGVLYTGTKTPVDTLNASDMADTVVDNDMLTVTSGAVFRAIKQLTDQIISLEARVKELEDGGV